MAKILGIDHLLDGVAPIIKLNLREADSVGARYVYGKHLILIDVPKTCRVEDLLPSLDHELVHFLQDNVLGLSPRAPRFVVEGMASLVELLLHGKIRGYEKELLAYIAWCLVQDRNHLCLAIDRVDLAKAHGVTASILQRGLGMSYVESARAKRRIGLAIVGLALLWLAPLLVGWIITGKPVLVQYGVADKVCGTPPNCNPNNNETCKQILEQINACRNVIINPTYLVQAIGTVIAIWALLSAAIALKTSE